MNAEVGGPLDSCGLEAFLLRVNMSQPSNASKIAATPAPMPMPADAPALRPPLDELPLLLLSVTGDELVAEMVEAVVEVYSHSGLRVNH